jgi:hypothetical protein
VLSSYRVLTKISKNTTLEDSIERPAELKKSAMATDARFHALFDLLWHSLGR